jgi:hypothetical protein
MRTLSLPGSFEVFTTSGNIKLRDIKKKNIKILSNGKWTNLIELSNHNKSSALEIKTKYGLSISILPENKILSPQNYSSITNLNIEDDIFIFPNTFNFSLKNKNKKINESIAYLAGLSYGDGYIRKNKKDEPVSMTISCSDDYPDIIEKIMSISKNIFNYDAKISNGDGNVKNVSIYNKEILLFFKENNILKEKSADIKFPKIILNNESKIQNAFLSGYFDADGYVGGVKKGYVFTSISLDFLISIQKMFIYNGIMSKIHTEESCVKNRKTLYTLRVIGSYSQNKLTNRLSNESIKIDKNKIINKNDRTVKIINGSVVSKDKILNIIEKDDDIYCLTLSNNDLVYSNGFLI